MCLQPDHQFRCGRAGVAGVVRAGRSHDTDESYLAAVTQANSRPHPPARARSASGSRSNRDWPRSCRCMRVGWKHQPNVPGDACCMHVPSLQTVW